jgi:hypothetical protein
MAKDMCDRCNWYNNIVLPLHNLSKYTFKDLFLLQQTFYLGQDIYLKKF